MKNEELNISKLPKKVKDRYKNSRKRRAQVNAASKRCRQRQKEELEFLRIRVSDLEELLKKHNTRRSNLLKEIRSFNHHNTRISGSMVAEEAPSKFRNDIPLASYELAVDLQYSRNIAELNTILVKFPLSTNPAATFLDLKLEEQCLELQDLLECVQSHADATKLKVESHFSKVEPTNYLGCLVKSIATPETLSVYTRKFYPNISLDRLQRDYFKFATGEKAISENLFYKRVASLSNDACIVDVRKIGELSLLAYGKGELAVRILISKWRNGDEYMFCINSLDIPDLVKRKGDCLQWASNGWIQMQSYTIKGVSGVLVTRYNTFGFCEKRGGVDHFLPVCGPKKYLEGILYQILDAFDSTVFRIQEAAESERWR